MWEKKDRLKDRYTALRIKNALNFLSWGYRKLSIQQRIVIVISTILSLAPILIDLYNTYLVKSVVNEAVSQNRNAFFRSVALYIGLSIFSLLYNIFYNYFLIKEKTTINVYLRKLFYKAILYKQFSIMDEYKIGDFHQRLQNDIPQIAEQLFSLPAFFLNVFVQVTGSAILIFSAVPEAGLLAIPITLILSYITYYFSQQMKKRSKKLQDDKSSINSLFIEHLSHMLIFRSYGKEDLSYSRISEALDESRESELQITKLNVLYSNLFSVLMMLASVGSMYYFLIQIMNSKMSFGTYTMLISLINRLRTQINSIALIIPKLYNTMIISETVNEIDIYPNDSTSSLIDNHEIFAFYQNDLKNIKFKNVTFTYSGSRKQDVFNKLNAIINKHDFVALTGPSGSGKSTFLKLILGLYHPDSGEIVINTKKDKKILDSSYRNLFCYVPQNNHLLYGTIKEAICFGEEVDENRINDSLKIASADEFVNKLPDGINTVLGENGSRLSEGQIQRLAIARAIYTQRPILLLDECTNSLDEATEKKILDNLKTLTDKTVIIISHRKSVIDYCDRIIDLTKKEK